MRILWVSSLAWKDQRYPYPVDGPGAVSGSLFQQSMIEALECNGAAVDIIADYPYAEKANRSGEPFHHKMGGDDYILPSFSNQYIRHFAKAHSIRNIVKNKVCKNEYDFVIVYLIHSPYMEAFRAAKACNKNIKTILICPDLPDMMDMSLSQKTIKKMLKKIDARIISNLYRFVDGFVLFTEYMKERIPVNEKPSIVIEGIATVDNLDISPEKKENAVMHAGTLHRNIGIENILEAMKYVNDPTFKLWIFGDGELKPDIIRASKRDARIVYSGFIDREELFRYEKKALALINARNAGDTYTRYSFPSKTFEYLYSGTPYITTKLKGTPEEYSDYLFEMDDNAPETIASAINRVKNLGERNEEAREKVRRFVRTKSAQKQGERLIDFLNKVT